MVAGSSQFVSVGVGCWIVINVSMLIWVLIWTL